MARYRRGVTSSLSDDGAEALEEAGELLFAHAPVHYLMVNDAVLVTITDGSDEGDISAP